MKPNVRQITQGLIFTVPNLACSIAELVTKAAANSPTCAKSLAKSARSVILTQVSTILRYFISLETNGLTVTMKNKNKNKLQKQRQRQIPEKIKNKYQKKSKTNTKAHTNKNTHANATTTKNTNKMHIRIQKQQQ